MNLPRTLVLILSCSAWTLRAAEQFALNPDEAIRTFQTLPGLKVELVASEPHVVDPVSMAFDEDGRIYAAEMLDYPLIRSEGMFGPFPDGQIRLMEDRDGDGVVDHSTIFATALSLPTSVLPYDGGVLVAAAPDIFFLKDTDGDGRADVREVVLTGFDTRNDLYRVNSLYYAPDGWIYARGNGDTPIHWGDDLEGPALSTKGGDFRFKPRERKFEAITGWSSCFGETCDDWGNRFVTNSAEHVTQFVLPRRYIARNPNLVAPRSRAAISDHEEIAKIFRTSPPQAWRVERGEMWEREGLTKKYFGNIEPRADYMTAVTGPLIYREALMPQFRGHYFLCEAVGNLVHHDVLSGDGPVFTASRGEEGREFLTSSDPWFSPTFLTGGPDGAIYVCDMYRQMIEHPGSDGGRGVPNVPVPTMQKYGIRAGSTLGRIYRIAPENAPPMKRPHLGKATPQELAALLDNPGAWWRTTAQRLLLQKPETAPVADIARVAAQSSHAAARAQALWTLDALGKLDSALLRAVLGDGTEGVRQVAVQLAESRADLAPALAAMANDWNPSVRFQLAFSLGEQPASGASLAALAKIAARDAGDRYLRTAVLSSATGRELELLESVLAGKDSVEPLADFCQETAQIIGARGDSAEAVKIEERARGTLPENVRAALRDGLEAGRKLGGKKTPATAKPAPAKAAEPTPAAVPQPGGSAAFDAVKPALDLKGDAAQGKATFTARCATCHRASGEGIAVGPDLKSVNGHPPSQVLLNIVEPNAAVIPNFELHVAETNEGESAAGIVVAQDDTSITLRAAAGVETTFLRRNLKTLTNTKTSPMPAGLLGGLTAQQIADLLAFIRSAN